MRFSTRFNIFPATGKAKKGINATAKGTVMTEPQQAYGRFILHAPSFMQNRAKYQD
jgi:hypothetical protein